MDQSQISVQDQPKLSFFKRVKQFVRSRNKEPKTFEVDFTVPETKRQCTDAYGILLLPLGVLILVALIVYCVTFGDIKRIKNGFDSCGNVCGEVGEKISLVGGRKNPLEERTNEFGPFCTHNNSDRKFLLLQKDDNIIKDSAHIIKTCVAACFSGYEIHGHKCIPKVGSDVANTIFWITGHEHFFKEVSEDLCATWMYLIYLAAISFGLSMLGVITLRYFALPTIWIVLVGLLLNSLAGTTFAWLMWYEIFRMNHPSDKNKKLGNTFLWAGVAGTTAFANIGLLVCRLRTQLNVVAKLYKEAGSAMADMPSLCLLPFVSCVSICVLSAIWLYFSVWIESSGHVKLDGHTTHFEKDFIMIFARWFNIFVVLWLILFMSSCQDMVVAGSVGKWYFARNKKSLKSPVPRSAYFTFRYHLGSISIFAALTSILKTARVLLKKLEFAVNAAKNQYIRPLLCWCECCLIFERILAFVSRNAFIEISLRGTNFMKSGKEAFQLLMSNRGVIQAISSTGDYVLFFLKSIVTLITVLIATQFFSEVSHIQHLYILLLLVAFFSFCISHCFVSVYEMVIDTIFICYCYDHELNDGVNKPYFMTTNLMIFIEQSMILAERGGTTFDDG